MADDLFFRCPHCQGGVVVHETEVNCSIFRHGVFIATGQQMNPHTPKAECDQYARTSVIYGCGKPFRLVYDGKWYVEACDYL